MARHIVLLNFTHQGAAQIKDSISRAHAFNEIAEKNGVTVEGQYWTTGAYDGAMVLEADEEIKILRVLSSLNATGFVRTQSIVAYTDDEFGSIIKE